MLVQDVKNGVGNALSHFRANVSSEMTVMVPASCYMFYTTIRCAFKSPSLTNVLFFAASLSNLTVNQMSEEIQTTSRHPGLIVQAGL